MGLIIIGFRGAGFLGCGPSLKALKIGQKELVTCLRTYLVIQISNDAR